MFENLTAQDRNMAFTIEADSSSPHGARPLHLFARVGEALDAAAVRAMRATLSVIASDLKRAAHDMLDERERRALVAGAMELARDPIGRSARISSALAQWAIGCLELRGAKPGGRGPAMFAIYESLEAQTTALALADAVRQAAGEGYREYADRIGGFVGGTSVDDESNPFGAHALASALAGAMSGVARTASSQATLREAVCRHLAAPLAAAIASVDAMLVAELGAAPVPGIEAGLPAGSHADIGELAATIVHDVAVLGTSALSSYRMTLPPCARPALEPIAEPEADAVALARATGVAPYAREARSEFFRRARDGMTRAQAAPAQLAVVDVVAGLFDYVIDDRRMPEPAKPLVWRLQQPALTLALLDPGYLGDEPRSLRRLVEHVGAISLAFADDFTHGSELYQRLDTVVRAVEIVAHALQKRSSGIARRAEREYARAARQVAQLIERVAGERQALEASPDPRNRRDYSRRPGTDLEQVITERIRRLIGERLGRVEVPESVREFLYKVWLRHLRTAALRNGEDSAEFRLAMEVVDNLLWSLDKHEAGTRRELAERIPPLIRVMSQGVREIGAKDDEYRGFFDELFLIHLRRMRRQERAQRICSSSR